MSLWPFHFGTVIFTVSYSSSIMIDRQDVAREHFPINDDLDIENFAPIQQLMKPASAHLQPVSITLFHALPPQLHVR